MIFPGLKKLGQEFGFKNNGTYIYGFLGNTYVVFADGPNKKNVWFRFPHSLDESDKQKIKSWEKKGYAKNVEFLEDQSFDVRITFMEYFVPFKIAKIKEVIEDITKYSAEKYPQAKPKCCGDNCLSYTNLNIYEVDGIPLPMCAACAQKLERDIEDIYEQEKLQPNNYLIGFIAAAVFSIPGILVSFFFFMLGKLAAVAGLVYYILAQKGYAWAKGKYNKIGIIIISLISLLFTALGTYISYVGSVVKELFKIPEMKPHPFADIVKAAFVLVQEPELKKELLTNIYVSLFICGVSIIIYAIQSLKTIEKIKVKKL